MIWVRRHLSKNWPGLPRKSLEISCNEGEGPQGPHLVLLVRKGRGPKYPAAHKLNGVVASVAFCEVVAATTIHGQDRRVRGSSHSSLSVSVLRLWLRDSSITASSHLRAVGVIPFLRRVRCLSGSQTLKKRPYCSLFSTNCVYFHATHFIASPRSPGIGI